MKKYDAGDDDSVRLFLVPRKHRLGVGKGRSPDGGHVDVHKEVGDKDVRNHDVDRVEDPDASYAFIAPLKNRILLKNMPVTPMMGVRMN